MTPTNNLCSQLREYNAWRRGNETLDQPSAAWVGAVIDAAADRLEELERELAESTESLAFQTQLNREVIELEKKTLGERNDARKELEQIKAVLADPVAVHLNMMRGTIAWTPANLRHLLGDTGDARAELASLRATLEDPDEVELAMIRGEIAIPHRVGFDYIIGNP